MKAPKHPPSMQDIGANAVADVTKEPFARRPLRQSPATRSLPPDPCHANVAAFADLEIASVMRELACHICRTTTSSTLPTKAVENTHLARGIAAVYTRKPSIIQELLCAVNCTKIARLH